MARANEFSPPTKLGALTRRKNRCVACDTLISALGESGRSKHKFGEGAQAHHVRHVKFGGTDAVANCVVICQACHYSAHEGGNYRIGKAIGDAKDYPHFND